MRRACARLTCRLRLVQVPLKPREYSTDHLGLPKIRNSVSNGIVVLEPQQWRQLLLIELLHTHTHVVRKYEVEEGLLLVVEVCADLGLRLSCPILARERRNRIGHVGEYVEQVAVFGIDDLLHFGQLLMAKSTLGKPLQKLGAGVRRTPQRAQFIFVLEEFRQLAEQHFQELLRGHRGAVRVPEGRDHHVLDGAGLAVRQFYLRFFLALAW